jgi:hypothetical protein
MPRPKKQLSHIEQITHSHERTMKQLRESLAKTKPGSTARAQHIKLIADTERRYRQELRDCGVVPSNLGPEQGHSRVWVANVATGPVEAKSKEEYIRLSMASVMENAQRMEQAGYWTAERAKFVAELEAEYSDDDVRGPSYEGENEGEDKDK